MPLKRSEAIRERARRALRELYHNATPAWSREMYGRSDDDFSAWFNGAAEFEIEYLQDGGAYGSNYRATLAAPCNAGKYKSDKARAYYVAKGMRAMELERADCGALTGWRVLELAAFNLQHRTRRRLVEKGATRNDVQWERITEYGKLYTWGRGGRTLAPKDLIKQGGGSFSIREDYADELSAADCVDLIRVLESFNRYVAAWNASVPDQWRDHCRELAREERAERKQAREVKRENARREEMRRCFC